MRRRTFLGAATATLASPALVRAAGATTLKFVPYADLALIDPAVSAFVTRNHAMMVYDTLFAMDEHGVAQPQMLDGYNKDADGLTWTLTLRDGLKFHDNTPVLGRDVVASLKRWQVADAFGQALAAATEELSAPTDKTIKIRLKRPFHLLPDALAHPTNNIACIMPERLANTPPNVRLTDIVGSGAYRYIANERVPGARNVYAKFDGYVPSPRGPASFRAGAQIAYFDRVEWLTTPDPSTQVAALKNGEVDWVEQPIMDLVPSLRTDRGLKIEVVETAGLLGFLRFNQLFPPFDNPRIRQAVLRAVNQREFMEAVVGSNAAFDAKCGYFTSGSPLASDAGMEALSGTASINDIKRMLADAGYKGERVVCLTPTDVPRINAIAEVGADMLRKIGMNVDEVSTDWGTAVQRTISRKPLDAGGWSMFAAYTGGIEASSPATHQLLRGNGANAYNGWPEAPKMEALRDQFLAADDLATRQSIAKAMQAQAMLDVPYLPVGSYFQPTAYKADLTGMQKGLIQFTGVRRSG
jgi:peptide/nickel transport system substrate-binding protein